VSRKWSPASYVVVERAIGLREGGGGGRVPYLDARNVTLLGMQIAFRRCIIIPRSSRSDAIGSIRPAQWTDIGRTTPKLTRTRQYLLTRAVHVLKANIFVFLVVSLLIFLFLKRRCRKRGMYGPPPRV